MSSLARTVDRPLNWPGPLKALWQRLASRAGLAELVALTVGALGTLFLTGYGQIDPHRPARIAGDHLFVVTYAKSYIEGHGFRYNAQLGYPDVMDNLRYPSFDATNRIWLWIEAKIFTNPFAAVHGLYIVGILAMFGFAYWALRRLTVRRWTSVLGAAATVLAPFLAARGYAHDFLVLSYAVPLGLGCALGIGTAKPGATLKDFLRDPFVVVTVLVVGTSGLYYAFYSVMFIVFAATARSLGQRRWFPVLAAASVSAPLFAILLAAGYGLDLPLILSGNLAGPHRFAFEQLVYGMEINSAGWSFQFVPKVAKGMSDAVSAVPGAFVNDLREWPQAPLALTILASPLIAAVGFQALASADRKQDDALRLITLSAMLVTFGLLFAVNGGLGFLFNLLVTPEIRSDARLMPFLTFAAIVIITVATEAAMSRRSRAVRYAAAIVCAALLVGGSAPQVGALAKIQKAYLTDTSSQQLMSSTAAMLQAKDKAGLGVVLELPVVRWPEVATVHALDPYQHELPYILDRHGSSTRWSYGADEGQTWFPRLQVAVNTTGRVAERMRALGFDGILVEKRGYDPAELGALQAGLAAQLAPACRLFDDAWMTLYALKSDPAGRSCAAALVPLGPNAVISFTDHGNSGAFSGAGWWPQSDGPSTWTEGADADLKLTLQRSTTGYDLVFDLVAFLGKTVPVRSVQASANGRALDTWTFKDGGWTSRVLHVPADLTGASIVLRLHQQNATPSPKDLGVSTDPRHVGVAVKTITVKAGR